jgi:hypothetical protein
MRKLEANASQYYLGLDNEKNDVLIARAGAVIQVVDASAPSARIDVRLNDMDALEFPMRMGDIVVMPFDRFWINSSAQSGQWIKLIITNDPMFRMYKSDYITKFDGTPRLIANKSITATLSAVISPSKELSKLVLFNDGDFPFYLGDASLAPSGSYTGDMVLPTERREFHGVNTAFRIYARCKTGETATMGVIEYD